MGGDTAEKHGIAAHDDTDRKAIHVLPCLASAESWRLFTHRHGVTLTALLDALGHVLDDLSDGLDGAPTVGRAVVEARRIDGYRRLRPKGKPGSK